MTRKMNMGLQRYLIDKIARKRGNPNHPDILSSSEDEKADVALENLDSDDTLSDNIALLESEGILLPVQEEEIDDYREKQFLHEQEELEREKEDRLRNRLWKFYEIKKKDMKL